MKTKLALCRALLAGEVINIRNCFTLIGYTNAPREISRVIEKGFGVIVSRTPMKGKSRYGEDVVWVNYRLNRTDFNLEGIQKMVDFVSKHDNKNPPRTPKEQKLQKQSAQIQTLFQ